MSGRWTKEAMEVGKKGHFQRTLARDRKEERKVSEESFKFGRCFLLSVSKMLLLLLLLDLCSFREYFKKKKKVNLRK